MCWYLLTHCLRKCHLFASCSSTQSHYSSCSHRSRILRRNSRPVLLVRYRLHLPLGDYCRRFGVHPPLGDYCRLFGGSVCLNDRPVLLVRYQLQIVCTDVLAAQFLKKPECFNEINKEVKKCTDRSWCVIGVLFNIPYLVNRHRMVYFCTDCE